MPRSLHLLILASLISCSPKLTPTEQAPKARQLAGIYVTGNEESLIDTLEFLSWNQVQLMSEYLPATSYFIEGDTLVVETDKAYLQYQILDDNTLLGTSFWVSEDTLKKLDNTPTPPLYSLSKEDLNWLFLNKNFYKIYTQPATLHNIEGTIDALKGNFQKGHARSGALYAQLSLLNGDTLSALEYSGASCKAGFFHACFQKGEYEMEYGQRDSALYYFNAGCAMGHTASCFMMDIVDIQDE